MKLSALPLRYASILALAVLVPVSAAQAKPAVTCPKWDTTADLSNVFRPSIEANAGKTVIIKNDAGVTGGGSAQLTDSRLVYFIVDGSANTELGLPDGSYRYTATADATKVKGTLESYTYFRLTKQNSFGRYMPFVGTYPKWYQPNNSGSATLNHREYVQCRNDILANNP